MATQQLVIDLSGRGGLADKWAGELISPTQTNSQTNYTTKDGEMMFGNFNPIKRKGYMSPNANTFVTVTPEVSFTVLMAASQVDDVNSDIYFFENGTKLHKADSFDDLALSDDRTISSGIGVDLAIYTLNGNRSLFYSFEQSGIPKIGVKDLVATLAPTFTANTGTDFITIQDNGWVLWENRQVWLTSTGTLPAGLSTAVAYYLKGVSGFTAQLSLTAGGAAIDITDTGTGVHSISLFIDAWFADSANTSAIKPKMIISGDGFMYGLFKNSVHRIDGTSVGGANGTVYQDVLLAPSYFYFSNGIDYRGNLYLVIQKNSQYQNQYLLNDNANSFNSEVGVYIWNRQSTFFNTSDFIPVLGVLSIHSIFVAPNGKVRIICRASNKTTQIREFNGTSFVVLKELGITSYPNYDDSVVVANGFTIWQGSDTRIYYYGKEPGDVNEFLFVPALLGTVTTSKGGAIAYADGGTLQADGLDSLYVSLYDGTNYIVRKVSPHSDGTYNSASVVRAAGTPYTGTKLLPRLSTVKHIDVYFAVLGVQTTSLTTEEATISIYFNESATAWATKSITRTDLNKGLFSIEVNKPFINSIQFSITWSANQIGTTDFCPSVAVVNYEVTTTIK